MHNLGGRRLLARLAVAMLAVAALGGCTVIDVYELSRDETAGRDNGTPGSALARDYIIDRLRPLADGLVPGQVGDAAYLQPFAEGTNVVAVVPGTDLADEYVIVGAHYDGLGSAAAAQTPKTRSATAPPTTPPEPLPYCSSPGTSPSIPSAARWCSRCGTARRTACSARATTSTTR